jgi:hypothetical protein
MTGRHEGHVLPSDVFIHDQFTALTDAIEQYFTDVMAELSYRQGSRSAEQLINDLADRHARATELLCTTRLLAAEVLRRV